MSEYDDAYMFKQHLSKIWSSSHEKIKQHWGWIEKKTVAYKKSLYFVFFLQASFWSTNGCFSLYLFSLSMKSFHRLGNSSSQECKTC